MPKGKVKSFLILNDIFELAVKSLLGNGWNHSKLRKSSCNSVAACPGWGSAAEPPVMALVAQPG